MRARAGLPARALRSAADSHAAAAPFGVLFRILIDEKEFLAGSVITHVIFVSRSPARINTIFVVLSGSV
jgi:hypothetical protein